MMGLVQARLTLCGIYHRLADTKKPPHSSDYNGIKSQLIKALTVLVDGVTHPDLHEWKELIVAEVMTLIRGRRLGKGPWNRTPRVLLFE